MRRTAAVVFLAGVLAACGRGERDIRAPGVVDGEITSVKALAAGTLERLLVQEGQEVKAGELVAEMNRDKVRNGLEELALAEKEIANNEVRARKKRRLLAANRDYWRKQEQRFERLQRSQSISGEQLEKARLQRQDGADHAFRSGAGRWRRSQIQKERIVNQRQALELAERDLLLKSPVFGVVLETFIARARPSCPVRPWPTSWISLACSSTCSLRRGRSRR